jgi:hypothetical protein
MTLLITLTPTHSHWSWSVTDDEERIGHGTAMDYYDAAKAAFSAYCAEVHRRHMAKESL